MCHEEKGQPLKMNQTCNLVSYEFIHLKKKACVFLFIYLYFYFLFFLSNDPKYLDR